MVVLLLAACRTVLLTDATPTEGDFGEQWDALLKRAVTEEGYVDYDLIEAERDVLDRYIAFIAKEKPSLPVSMIRHAFWLNAYNALVIFQVLERDRPDSVMDVRGWVPKAGSGFFVETAFTVDGNELSLWEIEHERVRMRILEPRDHAALNCASRSCPPMRRGIYTGKGLKIQLNEQMTRWVNDPERGVYIEDGVLWANPIFSWYQHDFEFWTAGLSLCAFTARFAHQPLRSEILSLNREGCPTAFYEYDWRLNDAKAIAQDAE